MVFTTDFLIKDSSQLAVSLGEPPLDESPCGYPVSTNDIDGIDGLRQQLDLVAIATLTTDSADMGSRATVHHGEPTVAASIAPLLHSYRFSRWLQQLLPFQTCRFEHPSSALQIYGCRYSSHRCSRYLVVWSKAKLTPLQQFCIQQQARTCYQQQQQSRIAELEDLIRQVGHQVRTPLVSIDLWADILRARMPEEQDLANTVQHLTQQLSATVQRLTSRSTETTPNQQDLQAIAQDSIQQLAPQLEQKRIALVGERLSYTLEVDPWQIQQVFSNLLSNAIAFSSEDGIIEFSWHGYHSEVLIEVRDQGPGFSPEDLRRMFQRNYSRRPHGLGLGLTIAQTIVHNHGGSIWAQNLPQGGAQLSISLPRCH